MKQKLKSEETQKLIIDSAFDLFYRQGFNNTSIPEIVKKANLTKGAFYHHFKDKKEVGVKVIAHNIRNRIYHGMIAPLDNQQEQDSIRLLTKIFTDRIVNFSKEEKELGCPANNLMNEIGLSVDELRRSLWKIMDQWHKELVNFIEKAKQKNEIRPDVNSRSVAIYLISSFEGIRGIRKVYRNNEVFDEYLIGLKEYLNQLK